MIDNDDDPKVTRRTWDMFGTDDAILRLDANDGYRWVEIRVRANGHREVWDCSAFWDDQAEAATWALKVEPSSRRLATQMHPRRPNGTTPIA